ncbi:MAG: type VII secretion-associated protein [Actinomycetota bacterium]|nr:type VII secretion-associated protein [Actinomycetota bacterium]
MTTVEVGPVTVRGPNHVDDELAAAAIESIDDTLMLLDDCPVRVRAVMTDLLRSAVGPGADELAVVHPSWWSRRRVEAVLDAAGDICGAAVAVTRAEALGDGYDAVVEIAVEHVVVTSARICTLTRTSDDAVCAAVIREIGLARTVVVDAPPDVGGTALATAIGAALRRRGVTVTPAATHMVHVPTPPAAPPPPRRYGRRTIPVLAGALVASVGVGAAAVAHDPAPSPAEPSTLLVEGRAAVVVPALWNVRRITDGGGSARVQITSPADPSLALHVTQSPLPRAQSLEQVGGTLLGALEAQPAGVFTDFHARDERGGRAVVTYRERRARHQTDWVVLVDDTLRIGIGCQSTPGRTDAIRSVCDAAVHSAHAVFGRNRSENGTG